ncbi:MAG TPA: glutathione S-transferase [Burkholderiales bacterium]|nr:glutathione S-transferase [Burkholderiales bacterium]
MKLHWSSRSPYVRKVMICAYELGLADKIERIHSVVSLSLPNAAVMRDNPLGKIPTLILDDGRILHDSVVICEYLDSLHAGAPLFPRLFPNEGEARWTALRRHALGNGMLDTLLLWRSEIAKPAARQTPEWLTTFALKIRNALEVIEADADAMAQTPFGIGHIGIGAALAYLDFRFADLAWRNGHPRSDAWMQQFLQRDSVQKTAFIDA